MKLCCPILLSAVLFLLPACKDKHDPTPGPGEKTHRLSITARCPALTPAGGASALQIVWNSRDTIAVQMSDGSMLPFVLESGAGTAEAVFSAEVAASLEIADKANWPWRGDAQVTGTDVPIPSEAEISDGYALFKALCAVAQIQISGIPQSATGLNLEGAALYGRQELSLSFPAGASSRTFNIPVYPVSESDLLVTLTASAPRSSVGSAGNQAEALAATAVSCPEAGNGQIVPCIPLKLGEAAHFRLLVYNVLTGMARDADNNYDNFVAWVKELAPDVLVLCESKNYSVAAEKTAAGFDAAIRGRAARWGHSYVNYVNIDNFPVAITAAAPFTLRQVLDDSGKMRHGAVHISTNGLEIVGLHLIPGQTDPSTGAVDQERSGRLRLDELQYVLERTLRNPDYASAEKWIFCGDYNMYSRLEKSARSPYGGKSAYTYGNDAPTAFLVYDEIAAELPDLVYEWSGKTFQPSMWHGRSRNDYIFASPSVYASVKDARVVLGGFPGNYRDEDLNPSDHFPLLLDLVSWKFVSEDGKSRLFDLGEIALAAEE